MIHHEIQYVFVSPLVRLQIPPSSPQWTNFYSKKSFGLKRIDLFFALEISEFDCCFFKAKQLLLVW